MMMRSCKYCPTATTVSLLLLIIKAIIIIILLLILLHNDDDSALTTATALSTDGQILLDFKSSIVDENGLLQDWLESDVHPCAWTGVTCDHTSKSVTGVFFVFQHSSSSSLCCCIIAFVLWTNLMKTWDLLDLFCFESCGSLSGFKSQLEFIQTWYIMMMMAMMTMLSLCEAMPRSFFFLHEIVFFLLVVVICEQVLTFLARIWEGNCKVQFVASRLLFL